jgi:hypothetical protein
MTTHTAVRRYVAALVLVFLAAFAARATAESMIEILDLGGCRETQVAVETYTDASMTTYVSDFTVYGSGQYALTDYITAQQAADSHYAIAYYFAGTSYCGAQSVPLH